jgi:hypothetical protein
MVLFVLFCCALNKQASARLQPLIAKKGLSDEKLLWNEGCLSATDGVRAVDAGRSCSIRARRSVQL